MINNAGICIYCKDVNIIPDSSMCLSDDRAYPVNCQYIIIGAQLSLKGAQRNSCHS